MPHPLVQYLQLTGNRFRIITTLNTGIPPAGRNAVAVVETDVLVIGGGAAGLAAAQALARAGFGVRLAERAPHLGDPWRKRHKNLTLNTFRDLSVLPGVRYREGTTAFPSRSAVVALFEEFARLHQLVIDYDTVIDRLDRVGDMWNAGAGSKAYRSRHVVVATGRDRIPFTPHWSGVAGYTGRLVHSADFGEASNYRGNSILVAGAGNSGFDVLNHLIKVDTGPLWLSARHAPSILPKRVFNLAVHKYSTNTARLPVAVADLVIAGVQRIAFGDLSKLALPPMAGGGASRLGSESIALAIDDGAVAAMKAGRIAIIPVIRSFDGANVILDDGRVLTPDVVIAATGYRSGLESMVGHLGVLDDKGRALFNGGGSDPKLPGLWFTGMRADLRGCFVNAVLKANEIARAIARS